MVANILIFSLDGESARVWSYAFAGRGWQSVTSTNISEAVERADENPFDLIMIDESPDSDITIRSCAELRSIIANPILYLSDDGRETRQIQIYKAGADECIIKPIGISLLLTKIDCWLRRSWNIPAETLNTLRLDTFELDSSKRVLLRKGQDPVKLTNLEFRLMHLLLSNPARILESDHIINRVWGNNGEGDCTLLKHVVYRLRRKVEPDPANPRHLVTIQGEGYGFQP